MQHQGTLGGTTHPFFLQQLKDAGLDGPRGELSPVKLPRVGPGQMDKEKEVGLFVYDRRKKALQGYIPGYSNVR